MTQPFVAIEDGALLEVVGGERCKQVRPGSWQVPTNPIRGGGMHSGAIASFGTRAQCREYLQMGRTL